MNMTVSFPCPRRMIRDADRVRWACLRTCGAPGALSCTAAHTSKTDTWMVQVRNSSSHRACCRTAQEPGFRQFRQVIIVDPTYTLVQRCTLRATLHLSKRADGRSHLKNARTDHDEGVRRVLPDGVVGRVEVVQQRLHVVVVHLAMSNSTARHNSRMRKVDPHTSAHHR